MAGAPYARIPPLVGVITPQSNGQPDGYSGLRQNLYSPPDSQSFIVTTRRRLTAASGAIVVAASSSNTGGSTMTIVDTLRPTDGLILEYLALSVLPADTTGHLTIVDCQVNLLDNNGFQIIPVGEPVPTTLIPRLGTTMQFSAGLTIFTAKDLDVWDGIQHPGTSIFQPTGQPLTITTLVSMVNNDAVNPHTFSVRAFAAYRVVQGLTGA